jgi:hypothetical protein
MKNAAAVVTFRIENAAAHLTGAEIRSLMATYDVTIRGLAVRCGITLDRVRQVRATGVRGSLLTAEWFLLLTGISGPLDSLTARRAA